MPIARYQMPDGRIVRFEVPEGTTPEQAQSIGASFAAEPQAKARSWSDVPLEAVKNIPSSAANFAGGIAQAVMHPIDTAGTLADAFVGGVSNLTPKPIADWMASQATPEQAQNVSRAVRTADAVGGMYKDRYGSMEGLKSTLATDPVGVAGDVSALLGGAGLIARQVPGAAGVANTLSAGSQMINPVNIAGKAAVAAGKGGALLGKNVLGLTTGVGPENVAQAFKSGMAGKTDFIENLSGRANMTDVLDAAKQNIQAMGAQKSANYRANMANVTGDKTVLNFAKIDKAIQDAANTVTFKGQIKNVKGAQVTQDIAEEVSKWKALNPAEFHTPEGLDALKQKIGGLMESIPFEEKTARMAAGNIYNSIKSEISAQAPTYAKTMKDYSEATDQIREIERALSLGNKAAADTGMRKLQSLARNNANANYGSRLELARTLEQAGGNELMPAIAGQAMSSWTSRGLPGQAGSLATMGGALTANPLLAALLPFQSPKAVGATLYGGGRLASMLKNNTGKVTPEQINNLALILNQAGKQPQEDQ